MAVKANTTYEAVITGGGLYEANSGSLGYQLMLSTADGDTDYTIWLTQKTKDNGSVAKAFDILGVPLSDLASVAKINAIDAKIKGKKVNIVTKEETFKDKTLVKVQWLNAWKPTGINTGKAPAARVAELFKGFASSEQTNLPTDEAASDEVPF